MPAVAKDVIGARDAGLLVSARPWPRTPRTRSPAVPADDRGVDGWTGADSSGQPSPPPGMECGHRPA